MPFDVMGQRFERAFNSRAIAFARGGNSKPREPGAAKSIGREQAMQIAALHTTIRGDRALGRTIDEGKGPRAVASLGAADMDFIGLDRLLGFSMLGFGAGK